MTIRCRNLVAGLGRQTVVAAALVAATSVIGGCGEDAGLDAPAELTAVDPTCRGRRGVLALASASDRDIVRIRLLDPEGRAPDLEIEIKERLESPTRYEVLWQDCGPRSTNRRSLLLDLAGGERFQTDVMLEWASDAWVWVTPDGVL
jgi:hypothetical protein